MDSLYVDIVLLYSLAVNIALISSDETDESTRAGQIVFSGHLATPS